MSAIIKTKPVTRAHAKVAVVAYRESYLKLQELNAEISAKKSAVDEEYAVEVEAQEKRHNAALLKLADYTKANTETIFEGDKKSGNLFGVTVALKLTPPSLKLKAKNSWAKVLASLKEEAEFSQYVTTKEDVNKTALKTVDADTLKALGLKLEGKETFSVKL
jgi:phage host-nuclease inhibitor protein Gam